MIDFDSLNENQRLAVEWNEGPLVVLAGPGSGKTRVLTMRVAKLLLDSPGKRFRVLGLTFTNKAASEMRARVEQMIPQCGDRVLLTTFHSFCADILRQHGNHVGIRPDFVILNQDADREAVLSDAIFQLQQKGVQVDDDDLKRLPTIDRLLANCVPESKVKTLFREAEIGNRLSVLYSEYRNQLRINNRLDFPSLLLFAYEVLSSKPAIAKQIQTIYPHVCVDEFQDTNLAQYQILKLIVGAQPKNLFVVADDDQIIYQWNGASPERLKSLREDFKMSTVQLPANYRCPPQVIVLANRLIRHNLDRAADKEPLYAVKKTARKSVIRLKSFSSVEEELNWVATDIAGNRSEETGSCVVLARTRRLLEQAVQHLVGVGLKASLTVRKNEFTSAPFRWLHSVLRLANARGDREQLRRICKSFFELEGVELNVRQIVAESPQFGGDFLRCWFEIAQRREGVEPHTVKFLEEGQQLIVERLNLFGFIDAALRWFSEQDKRLADLHDEGFVDYHAELASWNDLQKTASNKYGRDQLTLNMLLQEFDLSEKTPPVPSDAVRCLTIHSAKGMEFDHVYLAGLVDDQLPSYQSIKKGENSREMQEERRNCFVAITRTQKTLTMTYSEEYFGWAKKPSRFLYEMELLEAQ